MFQVASTSSAHANSMIVPESFPTRASRLLLRLRVVVIKSSFCGVMRGGVKLVLVCIVTGHVLNLIGVVVIPTRDTCVLLRGDLRFVLMIVLPVICAS